MNTCFICGKFIWPWQDEHNLDLLRPVHSKCVGRANTTLGRDHTLSSPSQSKNPRTYHGAYAEASLFQQDRK